MKLSTNLKVAVNKNRMENKITKKTSAGCVSFFHTPHGDYFLVGLEDKFGREYWNFASGEVDELNQLTYWEQQRIHSHRWIDILRQGADREIEEEFCGMISLQTNHSYPMILTRGRYCDCHLFIAQFGGHFDVDVFAEAQLKKTAGMSDKEKKSFVEIKKLGFFRLDQKFETNGPSSFMVGKVDDKNGQLIHNRVVTAYHKYHENPNMFIAAPFGLTYIQ